jgi:hypothetical protein
MFSKNTIIKEKSSNGLVHYRLINNINASLLNILPLITVDKINELTNKWQLKKLEKKYDDFLDKYQQLLLLHNNVDEYLEIRDAITLRISRIERMEHVTVKSDSNGKTPLVNVKTPLVNVKSESTKTECVKCGCIIKCNKHNMKVVQHYCLQHGFLKKKEEILENELTNVRKELNSIVNNL